MKVGHPWLVWFSSCLILLAILTFDVADGKRPRFNCRGTGAFRRTKKLMGYYPSYNFAIQSPSQVDYSLYTDVLFFVAVPQLNHTFTYGKMPVSQAEQMAIEFCNLAKKNGANPLLSYGGWTGSLFLSNLTATPESRKRFAHTLVTYAKKLGFTGLDLDWEYPNKAGIGCNALSPSDTVNFGLLVREIRRLWPDGQLTAALGITGLVGSDGKPASKFETALLARYLDFVNLMAYDVYGAWAPTTGPLAPIKATCAPADFAQSVETGFQVMLQQGFKPGQIILGLPAYAKRLQLVSSQLTPKVVNGTTTYMYQNHTKDTPPGGIADDKPEVDVCGVQQSWGGSWLTTELISKGWLSKDQKTGLNGYKRYFDECSGTPALTNGKFWITYEDVFTSVTKTKWASQNKLAGVYFFDTTGPPKSTVVATRHAL